MFKNDDNPLNRYKITQLNVDTHKYVKLIEKYTKFFR